MSALPLAAARSPAEIARASGSSFLTSFIFLSPGRRRALLAVYAFCRVVDDAVDSALGVTGSTAIDSSPNAPAGHTGAPNTQQSPGTEALGQRAAREQLEFWQEELDNAFAGKPATPTGFALHQAAAKFSLEHEPLADVCRGCAMDLEAREYADFASLETYMYRVASAVGIACLPIFGADPERARPYAEKLGIALQYTNILRDLAEDGDEGRCYIPNDVLQEHGLGREWLRRTPPPEALAANGPLARMLRAEHLRAAALYEAADALLPPQDRRALRPARIMGKIYGDLRLRVAALGPQILTAPRCRVPLTRKLYLATIGL